MTGFHLGQLPDLIHPIATTMVILAQDRVFEVAGERNAHSGITVAALNEKCVSCPPVDNTREVSNTLESWLLFPVEFE